MTHIRLESEYVKNFIKDHEWQYLSTAVDQAHAMLNSKTGPGSDFLGWLNLPERYDKEEFERIQKAAQKIRQDSDVLLVIGIGGSYLGARAAIEMLNHSFYNVLSKKKRKYPQIFLSGIISAVPT